jgi:hypothetical protein
MHCHQYRRLYCYPWPRARRAVSLLAVHRRHRGWPTVAVEGRRGARFARRCCVGIDPMTDHSLIGR